MSTSEYVEALASATAADWVTEVPKTGANYTSAVYEMFKTNPGKSINAAGIKETFDKVGIEIDSAASVLATLARQDKIQRVSPDWYTLKQNSE